MSAADDLQTRTDAFADLAIKFVEGLHDVHRIRQLASQFQDASTSVGANYRAARRARSHADFTSKIGIVSEEADELARIFGSSHRTAKRRGRRGDR